MTALAHTYPSDGVFRGLVTNDDMPHVLLAMQAADDIAVDTETSGLNVANPNCDYFMGACIDVPYVNVYIPFRHKTGNVDRKWLGGMQEVFRHKPLIWHNRKFDMHSFKTIGLDPLEWHPEQYDTMLIAALVNEEVYSKELDFLAKWYLKDEKADLDIVKKMGEIYGYANLQPEVYRNYGPKDAFLTRRLRDVLWPKLRDQDLLSVYWDTELPFNTLLFLLEQRGVGTRPQFIHNKSAVGHSRMATLRRELKFNPASPIDLGRVLLNELELPVLAHTKSCDPCQNGVPVHNHTGRASFTKLVLEEYDDILTAVDNPIAQRITEYRGWQKATTALYDPLLEKVGPDGKIRTNFKQHGTVTGRLSASEPNLQQIPRESTKIWNGDAKHSFDSGRPGYTLIGWDYSQLELRLAAAYGQEPLLLAEFEQKGADPFGVLTPRIFGQYTDELKQDTKTFVYANLYGAGVRKIALQLGRSEEETRTLYNNYHNSIPNIMNISNQVINLIKQRGYVKYWDGRRRHIRKREDAYKGWNSLLQGGGAQLVKKAMLRCMEFEDENCYMVMQVHDEITFVIRTDMIEHYRPLIEKAMCDWSDLDLFHVNFEVKAKAWNT